MNRRTLWIGAAVLVLAAGCNRSDTERTGSVVGNGDGNDRQASSITVTGCLQAGEQGLGSREPNAAARSAEGVNQFVLANARPAGSTSGDASTAPESGSGTGPLYILEGRANELRTHVGQQVEVTGKPQESDTADADQPNAQRLEVESVRMISQRCVTP
jgi:hypothetical protein